MLKGSKVEGVAPGSAEGAHSATGGEPGAADDFFHAQYLRAQCITPQARDVGVAFVSGQDR